MKEKLQHLLNPLNLWSRCGGYCLSCFRFYELRLWKPYLRKWCNGNFHDSTTKNDDNKNSRVN